MVLWLELTSVRSATPFDVVYYGAKSSIALQSIPYRPPQLRCVIFPSTYLPHLLNIPSDSYWASICLATLPDISSLICDFCPSDQRFAIRLPSDSTSRWTPLPSAVSFPLSGHSTDFHRLDYAHAGRTRKRKGIKNPFRNNLSFFDSLYYRNLSCTTIY